MKGACNVALPNDALAGYLWNAACRANKFGQLLARRGTKGPEPSLRRISEIRWVLGRGNYRTRFRDAEKVVIVTGGIARRLAQPLAKHVRLELGRIAVIRDAPDLPLWWLGGWNGQGM
jgi:hypothetical protein